MCDKALQPELTLLNLKVSYFRKLTFPLKYKLNDIFKIFFSCSSFSKDIFWTIGLYDHKYVSVCICIRVGSEGN
jgi:hypothetical protein